MQGSSTGSRLKAKKRFGQNFLIDDSIIDRILDVASVSLEDTVLEIGPGKGALTEHIAKKAGKLIAVEIDRDLAAVLRTQYCLCDNVEIIEGDFLKLDIESLLCKEKNLKVVANLPYYITTPIILKLLESDVVFEQLIVMVQREVALRMCAQPGTADYGALSLAVGFYTTPSIVCDVPNTSFRPVPKVDSCVVKLEKKVPICGGKEKENLFKCIKAAFSLRRKTLVNGLSSGGIISKEEAKEILTSLGLNVNLRGENLSLEEFYTLSKAIGEQNGH